MSDPVYCPVVGGCVKDPSCGRVIGATHVKVWIDYYKGGSSLFTHQESPGGYYLYIQPVSISKGMESAPLLVGGKVLLCECKRKGKVKSALAQVMYEKLVKASVIKLFGKGTVVLDELPDPPDDSLERMKSLL